MLSTACLAVFCSALSVLVDVQPFAGDPATLTPVQVQKDFCRDFAQAARSNIAQTEASARETCGGVRLPGFSLQPSEGSTDATLTFRGVAVPAANAKIAPFLLFRIGLRDGIPWENTTPSPNGVRFLIYVGQEVVFSEDLAQSVWRPRAVDLSRWAGQRVDIAFATNAIDGDARYDWAVFGWPQLITIGQESLYIGHAIPDTPAVAITELTTEIPADAEGGVGDSRETVRVEPGVPRLLVSYFDQPSDWGIGSPENVVQLRRVFAGRFAHRLTLRMFEPSSPLITQGSPYRLSVTLRNDGYGRYLGGDRVVLTQDPPPAPGVASPEDKVLPALAPGEEVTLQWKGISPPAAPGEVTWKAEVRSPDVTKEPILTASFKTSIFPAEPELPAERPDGPMATLLLGRTRALLATPWARLWIVSDASPKESPLSDAYGIAEVWNGETWERAGSIYPLARVVLAGEIPEPSRVPLRVRFSGFEAIGPSVALQGEATAVNGRRWPVRVTLSTTQNPARFLVSSSLGASKPTLIRAFEGPRLLAGDRAYGGGKNFALAPETGLLLGDEAPFSVLDTASPLYVEPEPLSAISLMAVQGKNSLMGMVWELEQFWTRDLQHPAAYFTAPSKEAQCLTMSLLAPGNAYRRTPPLEAENPFELKRAEHIRLSYTLILDSKARHEADSAPSALVSGVFEHYAGLRGKDMGGSFARISGPGGQPLYINSSVQIKEAAYDEATKRLTLTLEEKPEATSFTLIAPIISPREVRGCGDAAPSNETLRNTRAGWRHDSVIDGMVLKHIGADSAAKIEILW